MSKKPAKTEKKITWFFDEKNHIVVNMTDYPEVMVADDAQSRLPCFEFLGFRVLPREYTEEQVHTLIANAEATGKLLWEKNFSGFPYPVKEVVYEGRMPSLETAAVDELKAYGLTPPPKTE